ncbi:murein biosynthesis integral membrane protein MurJ [Saccharophagus degradans]|uniref:Probable lipid II flippase MurJ n=1 Tax=Saccharophagus degradans TaxID=86304 RepID=A0AAW7XDN4_9GAMM|nr:murein biosynthesis integral membrane protein MurJ [Saccharophagus degradans]MDO6424676.1 murein biosynthesis integral membrane protein MurJ [Saccharophagus degradans]MDO6609009.1 murein biosynthesis integral membrane protein MurJ [Saccharophagus degradans]
MSEESTTPPVKKAPGLLRSTALVGIMTMMSRVLGLARDVLFARYIGAGPDASAFFLAFKIPNFLRRLFAEGAFAQAFVPVLSEYRTSGSVDAVRGLIDRIAGCLGLSLIAITVVAVVAAPAFTAVWGVGLLVKGETAMFWLASDLLRITFPYLLLISLTGFAGAILNSYDRFAIPAITPVFLNVCLIVAAVFVSPLMEEPVVGLAWGVLAAGVVQFVFQLPFLAHLGLLPRPKVDWKDPAVKKVLTLMAPAMFGVSVSQINLMLDTMLATFLQSESIAWLYYSDRLTELPLGVFGIAIATVVLPTLSRQFSKNTHEGYGTTLDWALRMVMLIAVPAAIALIVLAKPVLFTLFQYGKTSVNDVNMAALSLCAYSLGLTAFMLIKVLASAYFSRQDTRTPVRIGIIAMGANMVLNLLFVVPLHFIYQIGHMGLAMATACSAFLNAGLLYRGLRKAGVYQPGSGWLRFFVQLVGGSACMFAALMAAAYYVPSFELLAWLDRCIYMALYVAIGLFAYVLGLAITGLRPGHLRHHSSE